jgi:nitrogen fixation NifU-like protein
MSELRDLYQEVILEHSRKPRNYGALDSANHKAEGYNPLCGDRYTVFLDIKDGAIQNVSFQGSGCAISKASASMMTQSLKGKTTAEAEALFTQFHDLVTGHGGSAETMGKLAVFAGVSEFPLRVKCATLAWHTLRAAMRGEQEAISTE